MEDSAILGGHVDHLEQKKFLKELYNDFGYVNRSATLH